MVLRTNTAARRQLEETLYAIRRYQPEADGLRLVTVKDMPSAWGVAAKAMIEFLDGDLYGLFAYSHIKQKHFGIGDAAQFDRMRPFDGDAIANFELFFAER